ncbi:MAG: hypothetical protein KA479_08760 [Saprospiraceae bacterium]|nr:hypothetical protein [Saprospiraceae bacterium]
MKSIILLFVSLFYLLPFLQGQDITSYPDSPDYDAALATQLGADDYGMKVYYMALLKPGPNRSQDEATAAAIQKAHMNHITQMAASGKLVVAGPFLEAGDFRGIFIFDVATKEEAEALTQSDPAVQAGRLEMVLIKWYGSAALKETTAIHKRISKKSINN